MGKGLRCASFFSEFRPHLAWRFHVDFYTGGFGDGDLLSYSVQSIKVSGYDVDTTTAASYYGDGYRTIPIVDTSSKTIEITFEETDNLDIIKFIDKIIEQQRFGNPVVIGIVVNEYSYKMGKTPIRSRYYSCILSNYEEPSFSRSGGVQQVTTSVTFSVMSERNFDGKAAGTGAGDITSSSDTGSLGGLTAAAQTQSVSQAIEVGDISKEFKEDLAKTRKRQAEQKKKEEEEKNNSSRKDTDIRPRSEKTVKIQQIEKEAANKAGVGYLAMGMANGGEGIGKNEYQHRIEITDAEIAKAKEIQAKLDATKGGKELQKFVEDLSEKTYWLGRKGKDGDISNTPGLDCSGAAGAWAEQMGYDIDEGTAGAKNGGLVKQLMKQGATQQDDWSKLKPGDILNKESQKEGNSGHVVIFLGYDGDGNMLIAESAGRTGEGNDQSAGGRIRTVTKKGMKDAGYLAYDIMTNAKPREKFKQK